MQLGIEDPSVVIAVRRAPAERVRPRLGDSGRLRYRQFEDPQWSRKFLAFLHGRAWTHAEAGGAVQPGGGVAAAQPGAPAGVSVLAKQVAMVRAVAEKRLYATVARAARRADGSLPEDLVALLAVPEGRRVSELERLRRPPTRTTGASMAKALERVEEISALRWAG
ncbi:hypothetical protein SGLAM104S_04854 [Streptomyces glaucescens]